MTQKTMTADELSQLMASATTKGVISPGTSSLITCNLGPLVLAGAAGRDLEGIAASDVTLVTMLIDASTSIADRGLEQAVRDGQGALIDAFAGAKERDSILLALWTFGTAWTCCTRTCRSMRRRGPRRRTTGAQGRPGLRHLLRRAHR